jgi:hypothetical protein
MRKILNITIKNNDDSLIYLAYQLYDNPVADRWATMTQQSIDNNYEIYSRFTNKNMDNIDYLIYEINKVIETINNTYDKILPVFTNLKQLDISILNYLHEEFEVYGDRIIELQTKNCWSEVMHTAFLRLNEWIHIIESAIHNVTEKFPNYTALYDFLPAGIHEPMSEEDKLFLETQYKWGGLYCGYNTLGKDYYAVCMDNDVEVIDREMVRPQRRFAAETWLNFGQDSLNFDIRHSFYRWFKNLTEEQKAKIPINDLNELTLGRLVLGYLIITENFLNFHNNYKDWMTPNHECKIRWNKEVFSKAKEIIKIEIV